VVAVPELDLLAHGLGGVDQDHRAGLARTWLLRPVR
jgi:hypothetical protein